MGEMDSQNQQLIKDAAEKFGAENCIAVLGSSDTETSEIYAETVTNGDPTSTGPLTEVSLGLPVYHIFDSAIREECSPDKWKEHLSMMEMVLEPEDLASAVKGMRDQFSKSTL